MVALSLLLLLAPVASLALPPPSPLSVPSEIKLDMEPFEETVEEPVTPPASVPGTPFVSIPSTPSPQETQPGMPLVTIPGEPTEEVTEPAETEEIRLPALPDGQGGWLNTVQQVVTDMLKKKIIDLHVLVNLSTKVIQRLQDLKQTPQQIWDEVQNMVDYVVKIMRQKNIDSAKIGQVKQTLYDALSIVAAKVAGIPGLPQGCWLGQHFRMGSYPSSCPNDMALSGPLCYRNCNQGNFGFGPFCFQGFRPSFRGWGQPPKCSEELVSSLGFCYKEHCHPDFPVEMGPFCLADTCPSYAPTKCGRLCLTDGQACTDTLSRMAANGQQAFNAIRRNDTTAAISNGADVARTIANYKGCPVGTQLTLESRP